MKKVNDYFNKILSLILIICLITSMFSGCAPVSNLPETEIDTEAIAETITSEIQKLIAETENQTEPISNADEFSVDWFVYDRLFSDYSLVYDTFRAVLHLEDGSEISGFGYTDYSAYYETTDGKTGFFPAGFIADVGGVIPAEETENGLIIENLSYTDEKYQFVYAYDTAPFIEHCVVDGKYLQYGVNDSGAVYYSTEPYQRGHCEESLGALYSYDEEKFLFDPEMGTYVPITGASVFEAINYEDLEEEVNRILREQDINFSQQDVITSAHIAQEAVISYFLSLQEETFLGCNVQELVECAEALDPMECIRITPEGHIIIDVDDDIPEGPDAIAKWSVGIGCGIVVISSIVLDIFCPAAIPFSASISGAALDVFFQVVFQNQNIGDIKWSKVAVAAVAGAALAWLSPLLGSSAAGMATTAFGKEIIGKIFGYGVQSLSNGFISGLTSYATAMIDGEKSEWDTHVFAATIAAVFTLAVPVLGSVVSKFEPKIAEIVLKTRPGKWLSKIAGKTNTFIQNHQIHVSQNVEDILRPKSIHEATRQAKYAFDHQYGSLGGGYRSLTNHFTQKHEMPSFEAVNDALGLNTTRNKANLPAIKISPEDHMKTASWGNSREAALYREKQAELIRNGKFGDALQMDIDDLHRKFGNKYDDAIDEMLEYAKEFMKNTDWLVVK